jgi:hypothetical protein
MAVTVDLPFTMDTCLLRVAGEQTIDTGRLPRRLAAGTSLPFRGGKTKALNA